jgi:amino acid transporter
MVDIYAVQILMLLACMSLFSLCTYMAYQARLALNGLARSIILLFSLLILLMALLILRRLDDALGLFDNTIVLSSAVVLVACGIALTVTLDMYYVYRQRDVYAAWMAARKAKEDSLEELWNKNERTRKWDQQGYQIDP